MSIYKFDLDFILMICVKRPVILYFLYCVFLVFQYLFCNFVKNLLNTFFLFSLCLLRVYLCSLMTIPCDRLVFLLVF